MDGLKHILVRALASVAALGILFSFTTDSYAYSAKNFYSARPDIMKVAKKGRASKIPGADGWPAYEEAYIYLLAQLVAIYPNSDFYFLARDIEYLYDVSKILLKDDPKMLSRMHIIPVSTEVSRDESLDAYLKQEGLTKKRMGNRSAVFVDSCCSGSIPRRLIELVKKSGINGQGFLISATPYPSSLTYSVMSSSDDTAGSDIEEHPHYQESATEIVKQNGKYQVLMGKGGKKKFALRAMQSLRSYYDNNEMRDRFWEIAEAMKTVIDYVGQRGSNLSDAQEALEFLVNDHRVPLEAFLTDVLSLKRKGTVNVNKTRINSLRKKIELTWPLEKIEKIADSEINPKYLDVGLLLSFLQDNEIEDFEYPESVKDTLEAKTDYFGKVVRQLLQKLVEKGRRTDMPEKVARQVYDLAQNPAVNFNLSATLVMFKPDSAFVKTTVQKNMINEECSYGPTSTLYTVIHTSLVNSQHLPFWVKTCLHEMTSAGISKLFTDMAETRTAFTRTPGWMSLFLKAMAYVPTIKKTMVQKIFENIFPYLESAPQVKFLRWLGTQREYWEVGIGQVPVYISWSMVQKFGVTYGSQLTIATLVKKLTCAGALSK